MANNVNRETSEDKNQAGKRERDVKDQMNWN